MNTEATTLELARTKYANNMPVQMLVGAIDHIKSQLIIYHNASKQSDPFAGCMKGIEGESGYSGTAFGVTNFPMHPVKIYGEQRAYTELFAVLVGIINELGETVDF